MPLFRITSLAGALAGALAVLALAGPARAQDPVLKPDGIIKFTPRPGLAGQTYPLTGRRVRDVADAMTYAVPLFVDAQRAGFMGIAYGVARDGELLTHAVSEDLLLIPGPPRLIRPGVGPISGVFEGFEDPLLGFEDPSLGFEDPLLGFEDPLLGIWGTSNVGFEEPALGFDSPEAALDAIWGNGGTFLTTEYAFVLISYPLAGNHARLSGDAVVVPFDLVDGGAGLQGDPPAASTEASGSGAPLHVAASPNPFRGRTAIRYEVAEDTAVRLAVYDVLGREVAVLVDERQEAGAHAAAFEAGALPGGTYLYRLEAGRHVATGRLTLVR